MKWKKNWTIEIKYFNCNVIILMLFCKTLTDIHFHFVVIALLKKSCFSRWVASGIEILLVTPLNVIFHLLHSLIRFLVDKLIPSIEKRNLRLTPCLNRLSDSILPGSTWQHSWKWLCTDRDFCTMCFIRLTALLRSKNFIPKLSAIWRSKVQECLAVTNTT